MHKSVSPQRLESDAWVSAYTGDTERQRRRAAMPGKLKLLGITEHSRQASVLDLCCGQGETLDALYEAGFRDLWGGDIGITAELCSDARFNTQVCDAHRPPFDDSQFDWILIIHALHHLGGPGEIQQVVDECYRMLKPGGRLGVIDFPNSFQIRLAFWWFRHPWLLLTKYQKWFGGIIREEWPFLRVYLPQFPLTRRLFLNQKFEVEFKKQTLFYFYWRLRKPIDGRSAVPQRP